MHLGTAAPAGRAWARIGATEAQIIAPKYEIDNLEQIKHRRSLSRQSQTSIRSAEWKHGNAQTRNKKSSSAQQQQYTAAGSLLHTMGGCTGLLKTASVAVVQAAVAREVVAAALVAVAQAAAALVTVVQAAVVQAAVAQGHGWR